MKTMKMLLITALFAAIAGTAPAQEAEHSGHDRETMTKDQLRKAAQEICPVSGEKLGAHGTPLKTKIGEEEVFLCREECVPKEVNTEHWATIHANIAKAQTKCPVMDRPLPKKPKSTIVEGRIVYICCPPCAKKIEADPKTYLQKVDALYAASIKAKQGSR